MNRKKFLSTLLSIIAILLLSVLATTQAQAQTCTPTTTVTEGDLAPGDHVLVDAAAGELVFERAAAAAPAATI